MPEISQMMIVVPGDGIKLVAAFVVGLLLGAEREYHDKSAGMRTLIMITVGSCLFTIFSMRIAGDNDPGRIAAQIVTGIGFLGAGVIIQGIGYLLFTIVAALLVIFVLAVLPTFERYLQTANALRQYKITTTLDEGEPERLMKLFKETNLTVREDGRTKAKDSIVLNWSVAGKPDAHRRVCDAMIHDPLVRDFDH